MGEEEEEDLCPLSERGETEEKKSHEMGSKEITIILFFFKKKTLILASAAAVIHLFANGF